ncbi:NAD-dependent epimerase/dehydratase family protein [Streptomyces actinomycinicus]|uniref:NAD-dependent epimerase/dehydratase family protein n=1 Tax=Streptomyces actinomycinicus TaxID=1695166 RepID=A0A937EHG8_9ACTN|nr:NAD-dependent epimerase/dehydratase family protein [Streptomyces actinomycinicus]MBL1082160.1 NAD-dependent epimerase/dehydratase family protein [Streptomyces actinomycinicus]
MSDICVIGGTRFFGKVLVQRLLGDGHRVTLVNRGQTPDPFGDAVRRLRADVHVPGELAAAVAGERFDAVIHQMCYTPNAAVEACEAFGERAGKIIMTSTIEVYNKDTFRWRFPAPEFSTRAREEELDPADYDFDTTLPWYADGYLDAHYGEGKRQAEAALTRCAKVPVLLARVAHVLAAQGDFTGRLQFHLDRVTAGQPVVAHAAPGRTSLVQAEEAAGFLAWAAQSDATGAVNVASPDTADVYDVCAAVESATGFTADVIEKEDPAGDPGLSPFSCPADFGMANDRAAALGYRFTPIAQWLPAVARAAAAGPTDTPHPKEQ